MKRIAPYACLAMLCLAAGHVPAQAFDKNNILLSLGLGAVPEQAGVLNTEHIKLPKAGPSLASFRPQLQIRTAFRLLRYISVGSVMTIDGQRNMYTGANTKRVSVLNVNAGVSVDFHFYQLIADKLGGRRNMHADKWDIYAGFTFGDHFRMDQTAGTRPVYQNKYYMSAHVGVRYFINERWSLFGEVGYGQSLATFGITYKFGRYKKQKVPHDF